MAGRKSKYKPEYCEQLVKFFDVEEPTVKTLPLFEDFAKKIKVSTAALWNWKQKFPDWAEAYEIAQDRQRAAMIRIGLAGQAQPAFIIFSMKNMCKWTDAHETKMDITFLLQTIAKQVEEAIPDPKTRHAVAEAMRKGSYVSSDN